MILHDHWCKFCGTSFEEFVNWDQRQVPCPNCGKPADRYYKSGCANTIPIDAAWIKTLHEVVDKDSKEPHCTEFLKSPTRENYHNWMKGEGIRHMDPGEKLYRAPQFDETKHAERVMELRQTRERIEI
jgi:rubrerythrin